VRHVEIKQQAEHKHPDRHRRNRQQYLHRRLVAALSAGPGGKLLRGPGGDGLRSLARFLARRVLLLGLPDEERNRDDDQKERSDHRQRQADIGAVVEKGSYRQYEPDRQGDYAAVDERMQAFMDRRLVPDVVGVGCHGVLRGVAPGTMRPKRSPCCLCLDNAQRPRWFEA
jgi:hypothetical protein